MIVERCTDLQTKFSAAHQTYRLETRLGRVQREVERVKTLRQQVETAAAILTTLSSTTGNPAVRAGIKEAARIAKKHPQLAGLWEELKSDGDLLGGKDLKAYKAAAFATANTCNSLRSAAERTWRDHASHCIQNDGPILDVFEKSNPEIVAHLRRLGRELVDLYNITAPSRAEIEKFDQTVAAYRAAFLRLGGDIRENVRKALQAAASPVGAPIHLFSPDVVAWLQKRRVIDSFRVIAKASR